MRKRRTIKRLEDLVLNTLYVISQDHPEKEMLHHMIEDYMRDIQRDVQDDLPGQTYLKGQLDEQKN